MLQSPPLQGQRQRVCPCSALPRQPLGAQGAGGDQGRLPARPATSARGTDRLPKFPPGARAQRTSLHLHPMCTKMSPRRPVPQPGATSHAGQVKWLCGTCRSGTGIDLPVAEQPQVLGLVSNESLLPWGQPVSLRARERPPGCWGPPRQQW